VDKVKRNRAKCANCDDIIESYYTHDFKYCKCGRIAVDGGKSYIRRLFRKESDVIEMSESS
jgi:hypothetical protein